MVKWFKQRVHYTNLAGLHVFNVGEYWLAICPTYVGLYKSKPANLP